MSNHYTLLDTAQDHIKRHAKESRKHNYTILLVPRVSTLVSRILEEEGVLGDVTIASYNLQFIPIAEDVISLEHENALRELWVVSEDMYHFWLAGRLMHVYSRTGTRPLYLILHKLSSRYRNCMVPSHRS